MFKESRACGEIELSTDLAIAGISILSAGKIGHMSTLQAVQIIETPIGQVAIGATDLGVSDVEILTAEKSRTSFSSSPLASSNANQAAGQLREYFQGQRTEFDIPLDLTGTAFQVAVWNQISGLGFGDQATYGQIAAKLGKPQAARAVGGAVGANPIPLIIGCHRVLGSNRAITGYSGGQGIKTKLWLLGHEGIEHR